MYNKVSVQLLGSIKNTSTQKKWQKIQTHKYKNKSMNSFERYYYLCYKHLKEVFYSEWKQFWTELLIFQITSETIV